MLVELKNGETLNGHLVNCDNWMNLTLKEVVQTTPEGDRFFRLPEVYVRGNNVCIHDLRRRGSGLIQVREIDKIPSST
jgi:small nuclear ribonucleoprotein (snRNP)-like protein